MPQSRSKRAAKTGATRHASPPLRAGFLNTHRFLLAALVVLLFATTDDRHVGQIGDGRQMVWTAVAMTQTGEIGQARGRDLAIARTDDAVSRYGMGMTLAQVPAAWLAPMVEARFGAGASQPLFLMAPFAFVIASGVLAGISVRLLGGGVNSQRAAILLATIGSPIGAYAALDFSEPLQAAAIAGAFACALWAGDEGRGAHPGRRAAAAGACAGLAVLTKSSLAIVAPLALLPLVLSGPIRRTITSAAAGAVVPLSLWGAFDFVRFGRLFGGYAGESFSHPWLDGFWRLLVSPNTGLLFFFPAIIAALTAVLRSTSVDQRSRIAIWTATSALLALLATVSGWWAWHGAPGWGPRLLLPAIPMLATVAAVEIERWRPALRLLIMVVSIAVNLPPLLQHPVPVMRYRLASAWPADAEEAARVPPFARRLEDSRTVVMPDQILSRVPRASHFVLLPWFWMATHGSQADAARSLADPPWIAARPDLRPAAPTPEDVRDLTRTLQWRFWGRGFAPDPDDAGYGNVFDSGLASQVLRAQQQRRVGLALDLAGRLVTLAPQGFHDALMLESFRLANRASDAAEWLSRRPATERSHPAINIVLALFERDAGNEAGARTLLETSAAAYPDSPVQGALQQPLAQWPPDFAAMTEDLSLDRPGGEKKNGRQN